MPLTQIAYMSTLNSREADDLEAILRSAVEFNSHHAITGMLLCMDTQILQILEGPADAIDALFVKISRDPRHRGMVVLLNSSIDHRRFPGWSMGFHRFEIPELDQSPLARHIFRADTPDFTERVEPGDALDLLESFASRALGPG